MNLSSPLHHLAVSVSGNHELNKLHCSTKLAQQPPLCSLSQTLGPGVLPPGIPEFKNVTAGRDLSPHLVLPHHCADGETEVQGGKYRTLAFPLSPASASGKHHLSPGRAQPPRQPTPLLEQQ